jgi:lysyl-tRNA synthetase class 1
MTLPIDTALIAATRDARAWPFEEARRLIKRLEGLKGGEDKTVLFETGYGPSGLSHIGTFGEVAPAWCAMPSKPSPPTATRRAWCAFPIWMLAKIPDNVPNKAC